MLLPLPRIRRGLFQEMSTIKSAVASFSVFIMIMQSARNQDQKYYTFSTGYFYKSSSGYFYVKIIYFTFP